MKRFFKWLGIAVVLFLIVAQFVPVDRTNPAVDVSKTIYASGIVPAGPQSILQRSCANCHSNETIWPWYSHVAPVSWLVASDVHGARHKMNLSEWAAYTDHQKQDKLDGICEMVSSDDMPPSDYTLIHRTAVLTQQDRDTLCQWVKGAPAQTTK
jgi:hypothetical protein